MEMSGASSLSEQEHSEATFWSSDITPKLHSTSLESQEDNLSSCGSPYSVGHDELSSDGASQVLWATGTYSGPIPNGFYSVIPDKKLKESYDIIPSPEELCSLGIPGLREEVILVDADRDKKLSRLKQLSRALVKGQNANPASVIKKLAGLVWDFYKRPSLEPSPAKASTDDKLHLSENRGFQLLGQLRHGSCRPRAILFKVLADAVGLESKLVVGLPRDGGVEYIDAYKHMSVVVVLNSVELLVDLMRYPGQLIPFSAKAIFISHISTQGESDSAENDSCDSPLEPNSPLCGLPDGEGSHEQDENHLSLYQRRAEALSNAVSSSFRNLMGQPRNSNEGMLSLSQSEPNVANIFPRRSQRKAVIEQRTASSSPEHPFFRRNKSILGGGRQPQKEYPEGLAESRSAGASISETHRRTRRRSISMTPEIGDDIVRVVKAMNEKIKQNRLLRDNEDEVSHSIIKGDNSGSGNSPKSASTFSLDSHDQICVTKSVSENQINSNLNQKATSLPSSPHNFRGETSDRSGSSSLLRTGIVFSTMNKMLQASQFLNGRCLLPFQEWNIDFSELTVGTRVGIGFFGEVFRGIWNGTDVAIKVFLEQDITSENIEDFCNEISILSRLRHPNVILFLGACMRPPHLSMVTEYMEMGSLYYLIHMSGQKKKLNWRRRFRMLADICRGLMCIHRMKIIHRDLKSANCLVDKHWTVKICDFGLSRIITDGPMRDNSSAGTPEWMAPELIRNEPFTNKCDIFSFGVIVWELCTLSRPWEGIPAVQVVYAVANEGTRLEIPEGPLGKLIADCWAEPDDRPSCQEILSRLLDCEYTLC